MSYQDDSYLVVLDCKHAPIFHGDSPPVLGDVLICVKCDAVKTVVAAPPEFRFVCTMCGYGRKFGRASERCTISAIRHARKLSHVVVIYDGTVRVRSVGTGEQQLPIAMFPVDPPY